MEILQRISNQVIVIVYIENSDDQGEMGHKANRNKADRGRQRKWGCDPSPEQAASKKE